MKYSLIKVSDTITVHSFNNYRHIAEIATKLENTIQVGLVKSMIEEKLQTKIVLESYNELLGVLTFFVTPSTD